MLAEEQTGQLENVTVKNGGLLQLLRDIQTAGKTERRVFQV
jgi:hypothetical protein